MKSKKPKTLTCSISTLPELKGTCTNETPQLNIINRIWFNPITMECFDHIGNVIGEGKFDENTGILIITQNKIT